MAKKKNKETLQPINLDDDDFDNDSVSGLLAKMTGGKSKKSSKKETKKESKSKNAQPVDVNKEALRQKMLEVMAEINKKHGEGAIILGSELEDYDECRLDIGNFALDIATGGGVPEGGIISLSGPFSSAKTANALHFVARRQREGKLGLWIATERFNKKWARQLGVDTDLLLVNPAAGQEEALQIAIDRQRDYPFIEYVVIDSIAALVPTKQLEKDQAETMQMGIKQQQLDEFLRKFEAMNNLRRRMRRKNPDIKPLTLFLINQLREKPTMFGDPEYEPGGRALGFYSDIMVRLRHGNLIYYSPKQGVVYNKKPNDGVVIGRTIKFRIYKNKTARMEQQGEYDIYTDKGGPVPKGHFDNVKAVIMEGLAWGVIETVSQGVYKFEDVKVRGKDNLVDMLRENPDLVERIKDTVIAKVSEYNRVGGVGPNYEEIDDEEED